MVTESKFYNGVQIVINKRSKTFTYYWLEDFVNETNGDVHTKIKYESLSYSVIHNPTGLQDLLSRLNVRQFPKSHNPSKIAKYIIN